MNRDKQIEELAEVLWEYNRTRDDDAIALGESLAEYLLDAGYRKASDVAREIFEEIEKCRVVGSYGIHCYFKDDIDELKKTYTEGER